MAMDGSPLTPEVVIDEARLILRTLLRKDLFGERIRLKEVEEALTKSLSIPFSDYCGFLNKQGYVRVDQLASLIEMTAGGASVAQGPDDPEFNARLARHFSRELTTGVSSRPARHDSQSGLVSSLNSGTGTGSGTGLSSSSGLGLGGRTGISSLPAAAAGQDRDRPMLIMDDVVDRRYRREELIGTGTIGAVSSARHIALGCPVALKEIRSVFQFASYLRRDEIIQRLRTAVEAQARLSHPGIIPIIDQNVDREHPYLVMSLAHGGNLRGRQQAEEGQRLAVSHAVRVLLQLSYALEYAHGQGVLHLGIKPENVLFDAQGNAMLADFGMSAITEKRDGDDQTPVLVGGGTVGYMAPERLQPRVPGAPASASTSTPAVDIYALGVLFYEMVTGRLPGRRSPLPSEAQPEIPRAFDDVFDRMTRDELSERYATMSDVLEGIYRAFPADEVFQPKTLLLWASDPRPPVRPLAQALGSTAQSKAVGSGDRPGDRPGDRSKTEIVSMLDARSNGKSDVRKAEGPRADAARSAGSGSMKSEEPKTEGERPKRRPPPPPPVRK
ncbi:MAG: serine/threonine protein kinase [Deltaproteobacteria bacterium]|nr:serine/threonine protein kinase [Deltaproteobacteria bacterium]